MIKEIDIEFKNKYNVKIRGTLKLKEEPLYIFVHGFLRSSNEEKFKAFDENFKFSCFYLDFEGCGKSEGTTEHLTVENWTEDLEKAIENIQKYTKMEFSFFAHSLGCCVVANFLGRNRTNIENIIFMAPALNQKDLLRYWFVKGKNRKVKWENFKEHLNEEEFLRDCRKDKIIKGKFVGKDYFLENMNKNYAELIKGKEECFIHIHGENDEIVSIESLNLEFKRSCIIKNGDHDLEGEFLEIWINYLKEELK